MTAVTPNDPLAVPTLLFDRNEAWANDIVNNPYTTNFFLESAKGQTPKIFWLGCSDSRVPETVVTNLAPGDIFVHRNIANEFHASPELDLSAPAVLDYAVKHLNVQHVAIVGHTHCGGVEAAYNRATQGNPDHLTIPKVPAAGTEDVYTFQHDHRHLLPSDYDSNDPLIPWLGPLTELARELDYGTLNLVESLTLLMEENVKQQVQNVANTFPKGDAETGEKKCVWVHGWVYEVERGRLRDLEVTEECIVYVKGHEHVE